MHRLMLLAAGFLLVITTLVLAGRPAVTAQEATPSAAMAGHPLVGSWLIAVAEDSSRPQTLNTFWADGNALFTLSDGTTFQGTWVATGPRTAALTVFAIAQPPGEDAIGLVRISSSFNEVEAAGDTFSGEADIETIAYDGTVLESVHVSVVGTRITIQPMGTPAVGTPAP